VEELFIRPTDSVKALKN